MTILVYLDQKDYGALLVAENHTLREQMRAWVEAGEAVAPVSMIHFVETAKAEPRLRTSLFEVMLELSRGSVVRGIPQLVALEERARGERELVRKHLLSTSFFDMVGAPGPTAEVTLAEYLAATNTLMPSVLIHDAVERSWNEVAASMNANRDEFPTLAAAYGRAFRRSVGPGDLGALRSTFPHLAVTHAIQVAILTKVPTGLTGHDIGDSVALGTALPYFDVVGLDRRMLARVGDAGSAVADLRRARIERSLPGLVEAVRSTIAAARTP